MPEASFGCTTDIVDLTGGLSRNFALMKFGGCPANVFFSASTRLLDFPRRSKGPGRKKRRWVLVGRRRRWTIRRPFENESPAKTASCSTPKAAQAGASSCPKTFAEGEAGGRGE